MGLLSWLGNVEDIELGKTAIIVILAVLAFDIGYIISLEPWANYTGFEKLFFTFIPFLGLTAASFLILGILLYLAFLARQVIWSRLNESRISKEGLDGWDAFTIVLGLALCVGVVAIGAVPIGGDNFGTSMFLFFLVLGFLASLLTTMNGFRAYRRRNILRDTPTSTVRSLALGPVEVEGTVSPVEGKTVEAPFSGEECLFYGYRIEEYRSGKGESWWVVERGTGGTSFYLEDSTGRVLVNPRGADLRLPDDNTYTVDTPEERPSRIEEFLQENDIDFSKRGMDVFSLLTSRVVRRRFTEWYVTPGDTVYVFGTALERPERGGAGNEDGIVIGRNRATPLFLITTSPENEFLSSLGATAVWKSLGGTFLTAAHFAGLLALVGLL